MMMMMMHVVKCCKRASAPQALLPITHVEIQSYIVNADPNEGVLLAASGAQLGPAAKTNRDLMFYWISQEKHRGEIL